MAVFTAWPRSSGSNLLPAHVSAPWRAVSCLAWEPFPQEEAQAPAQSEGVEVGVFLQRAQEEAARLLAGLSPG
ncbi:hypothetical protein [Thermus antranikianii]|uniref:hypothetical protein n=1 Tax=Thermus antranikianii TaxID=88190 RepID=UPI002352F6F3|nr:hypothetical protein [Thermus antranikianii]